MINIPLSHPHPPTHGGPVMWNGQHPSSPGPSPMPGPAQGGVPPQRSILAPTQTFARPFSQIGSPGMRAMSSQIPQSF